MSSGEPNTISDGFSETVCWVLALGHLPSPLLPPPPTSEKNSLAVSRCVFSIHPGPEGRLPAWVSASSSFGLCSKETEVIGLSGSFARVRSKEIYFTLQLTGTRYCRRGKSFVCRETTEHKNSLSDVKP